MQPRTFTLFSLLKEAIQIARENSVFEDDTDVGIEVRPIKVMEGINA